jgi:hypothetical protein
VNFTLQFEPWMLLELCKVMSLALVVGVVANMLMPITKNNQGE